MEAMAVVTSKSVTLPRITVAGATGLVGRAVLGQLGADLRIGKITVLVRQPGQLAPLLAGIYRARGQVVDYTALGRAGVAGLPPTDWAFCCLGTTLKIAGSQAAFRAVDFEAVLAFARAAKVAGASRLAVISALGADARSSVVYNRVKGEMEQALRALDLPHLVIARPSLLLGQRDSLGQPGRPGEAIAQSLAQLMMPALGWLMPRRLWPIRADAVASALIVALASGPAGVQVIESDALQKMADTTAA
jgi:uncharacterized protein YbjT (DUF2867 family)